MTPEPMVDERVVGLAVHHHQPDPGPATGRVVLVHGSMDRAASFLKVTRRLPDLEIDRYDRRGYGRSVEAGVAAGLDEQVDDLLAVIGDRPAAVVGHSLGGVIALTAASRHPDLIASVGAFEAPMSWRSWWPTVSAGGAAIAAEPDVGPEEGAERFMRRLVGDDVWEGLPARTRAARRSEGRALVAELRAIRGATPYEPHELVVPVVAGHGGRSKPYHQEAARRLALEAPLGELIVIEDAGHGAHASHPEAFAALVRRVVERAGVR